MQQPHDEDELLFDACFNSLPDCCAGGSTLTRVTSRSSLDTDITPTPPSNRIDSNNNNASHMPLSYSYKNNNSSLSMPPPLMTPPKSPPPIVTDATSSSVATKTTTTTGTVTQDGHRDDGTIITATTTNYDDNASGATAGDMDGNHADAALSYQSFMEWVGANVPFIGGCGDPSEVQQQRSSDSIPNQQYQQQEQSDQQQRILIQQQQKEQQQQRQLSQAAYPPPLQQPQRPQKTQQQQVSPPSFNNSQSSWLSGHSYLITQPAPASSPIPIPLTTNHEQSVQPQQQVRRTQSLECPGYQQQQQQTEPLTNDQCQQQEQEQLEQQIIMKRTRSQDHPNMPTNSRPNSPVPGLINHRDNLNITTASINSTRPPIRSSSPTGGVPKINFAKKKKNKNIKNANPASRSSTPDNIDCSCQFIPNSNSNRDNLSSNASACSAHSHAANPASQGARTSFAKTNCDNDSTAFTACGPIYAEDDVHASTLENQDAATVASYSTSGTNATTNGAHHSCHASTSVAPMDNNSTMRGAPSNLLNNANTNSSRSAPNSRPSSRPSTPFSGGIPTSLDNLLSRGGGINHNIVGTGAGTASNPGSQAPSKASKGGEGTLSSAASVMSAESLHRRIRSWGKKSIDAIGDVNISSSTGAASRIAKRHVVDIRPYAAMHDELIEALFDDALRGSNKEGELSTDDIKEVEDNAAAFEESDAISNNSTTQTADDSLKCNTNRDTAWKKKSYSPHRIKRASSSAIWKRNKSKQPKEATHNSVLKKQGSIIGGSTNTIGLGDELDKEIGDGDSTSSGIMTNSGLSKTTARTVVAKKRTPSDLLHSQCKLYKEKGQDKKKKTSTSTNNEKYSSDKPPSAIGREATLAKLKEKLSLLGDIESGKFGKAAEMLRSDAVAFAIRGNGSDGGVGSTEVASSVSKPKFATPAVVAETRSLLTLQMGFVSISYGILLQWECVSQKAVLIVLRKMCRDDFLERNEDEGLDDASLAAPMAASAATKLSTKADASNHDSNRTTTNAQQEDAEYASGSVISKMSLPLNPVASLVPRFLSEPSSTDPPSFLSVSVLNVKQMHGGCDLCRDLRPSGETFFWSADAANKKSHVSSNTATQDHRSKTKGKHHNIRPYIRFVLGKHEHLTKPAKFNNGNPAWFKVHQNSCLLPCPPDDHRWFAGQEDLIVEVRNKQSMANTSGNGGGPSSVIKGLKTPVQSEDPILAVVTVPLSSVNIEDGGGNKASNENDLIDEDGNGGKLSVGERLTPRKLRSRKFKDKASSTVTLPIRMRTCPSAPFGSITLQITIKASPTSSSAMAESIEIGPFERLMNGWSQYESSINEDSRKNSASNEKDSLTTSAANKKSSSYRGKIRNRLRWSKKFDHRTKKWSNLKSNPSNVSSTSSKIEDENANGEGNWIAFLVSGFRESNRDLK